MIDLNTAGPQRTEQIGNHDKAASADPVSLFLERMAEYGLQPGVIDISGKLTRFDVEKRGDKAGWYVYFQGDIAAGSFGNWQTDLKETWCSRKLDSLTWEQRARYTEQVNKAKENHERETRENHQKAKETANRIWQQATPIEGQNHPYLIKKNIQPHYAREYNGDLVLPQLDDKGEIWSLQFIKPEKGPDGKDKKFLPLGKRDGLFFEILGSNDVFLCEGYSTGATIHEATDATVICAFNAGSLPKVAKVLKTYLPGRNFTIAADNDQFKPDKGNAGIKKANEAAQILNAPVIFPTFRNLDEKPTDFNDLARLEGSAAVSLQLGQTDAVKAVAFPPLKPNTTHAKSRVLKRPNPKAFLWTCSGQGFLPKGVVGVLAATGGTGKTFLLCSFAAMSASGLSFGPIQSTNALKTLILCGEDDQEEIDRRIWDVTKGNIPEYLHAASVYGSVGPLMELEGNKPVRAAGFYWLEETIVNHSGIELLIIDPKSRFYGLDENNNDHATQWIQSLEYLAKHYDLTILFSAHTSDANSGKISQKMNRGASALVDGCRWQAGLVRMDEKTAKDCGIDNPRDYVVLDVPKSNYAADVGYPLYFKRTDSGALVYCNIKEELILAQCNHIYDLLKDDPTEWTRRDLRENQDFLAEIRDQFPKFTKQNLYPVLNKLIDQGRIVEMKQEGKPGRPPMILKVIDTPL